MDSNKLKLRLDNISEVNPALTCYHRDDPAPVLPLRDEPDLLSWLENTGRLVAEKTAIHRRLVLLKKKNFQHLWEKRKIIKLKRILH